MIITDLPSWLSAVGTVGAFAVALFLLGVQIWDRRGEAQDRRMAQARLVSTWWSDVLHEPEPQPVLVILVRNGSAEPVYGVLVRVQVGVRGTYVRQVGVLGPGETRELQVVIAGYLKLVPAPDITFKDAAGRTWMRPGTGELTEGAPSPPFAEDPGAYSIENHPTLALGHGLEANRGRKVK